MKYICSIGNEAVLKALLTLNDDELTFDKAVEVSVEVEDSAKLAKETLHGFNPAPVLKMNQKKPPAGQKGTIPRSR